MEHSLSSKVSIVVLCYNQFSLTHQVLMDIKRHTPHVHQVIVVDNGSEDAAVQQGLGFWKSLKVLPLEVYTIKHNVGFIGGMNRGISLSTGDITILLSNDVRILSKHFIPVVLDEFMTNSYILLGGELYTHDTGWNKFADDIVIPYVEGWCLIADRDFFVLNQFDDRYGSSDFEDIDLSMQAVDDGYTLRKLPAGLVQHKGGATYGYNPERLARTNRNRKLFSDKWGLPID